jgi:hypothetical protein
MKPTLLLAAIAACATAAHAQSYIFSVNLSGASEVPSNGSSATGTGSVTLDLNDPANPNDNTVTYSISYSGLSANTTAAHFHGSAPAGSNAGVILGLTGQPGQTGSVGATSGTFAGNNVTASPTLTSALLNGLSYVNVHNASFPGGEIRGQVTQVAVVPEVDSAVLVGGILGLGAIAWRARRK